MAKVKKVGKRFHVVHDTTGATLRRGGKPVTHSTRAAASKDAAATRRRVMGRRR